MKSDSKILLKIFILIFIIVILLGACFGIIKGCGLLKDPGVRPTPGNATVTEPATEDGTTAVAAPTAAFVSTPTVTPTVAIGNPTPAPTDMPVTTPEGIIVVLPTPTPTATATPTPTVTPTPTATSAPTATPTPTVTQTPKATATPTSYATPLPTATMYPEFTPDPSQVVETKTKYDRDGDAIVTDTYADGTTVETTHTSDGDIRIVTYPDGTWVQSADEDDYTVVTYPDDSRVIIHDNGLTTFYDTKGHGTHEVQCYDMPAYGIKVYFRYHMDRHDAVICNSDGSDNKWSDKHYDMYTVSFGMGPCFNVFGMGEEKEYTFYTWDGPFYDY